MDNRSMEQQVWQRVQANRGEQPRNDLRQLQREAMELAAIYRSLSSQLTGSPKESAQKLYRGEKANVLTLAGLEILSQGGGEAMKLWQPQKEDPKKLLQRCYHRTRRCMTEYQARSAEAEYGVVFDKLAKREAEHCTLIAEILGTMG